MKHSIEQLKHRTELINKFNRKMIPFVGSDVGIILRGESVNFYITYENTSHNLTIYYHKPIGNGKRELEISWYGATISITSNPHLKYLKLIGDVIDALRNPEFTDYIIESMNKFYEVVNKY